MTPIVYDFEEIRKEFDRLFPPVIITKDSKQKEEQERPDVEHIDSFDYYCC